MPRKGANSFAECFPSFVARAAASAARRRFRVPFSLIFFPSISTYLLRRVPRRRAALGARLGALERDNAADAWE